jgi:hypothetical protein
MITRRLYTLLYSAAMTALLSVGLVGVGSTPAHATGLCSPKYAAAVASTDSSGIASVSFTLPFGAAIVAGEYNVTTGGSDSTDLSTYITSYGGSDQELLVAYLPGLTATGYLISTYGTTC